MKTLIICALLIQLLPSVQSSQSASSKKAQKLQTKSKAIQDGRNWQAGTYSGLTAGKSTRVDVLRILGNPKRIDTPPDQTPAEPYPEAWYVYGGREFAGELTVVIDKRRSVVSRIDLAPDSLSKREAVKHFGPDYILTRYDFDECLGNEESAPVYESANGPLLEVEYRHRGIAIAVNGAGKVNTISYVSEPVGAPESRCNPPNRKKETAKKNPGIST